MSTKKESISLSNKIKRKIFGKSNNDLNELKEKEEKNKALVKDEMNGFDATVSNAQNDIQSLSDEVMNIAYSINEISKETSDAAKLTEVMNSSSVGMKDSIVGISSKANDALDTSEKIAKRAEEMMASSIKASEKATMIYESTKEQLTQAISKAKNVEEIRNLAEKISDIADNTNLISLNAAIEAARAGEAGKGFAVVASTIRELSDSTQETVDKIQAVADEVVDVMNFLSESSKKLLDFMNEQVIGDYTTMVNTAKQYKEDALLYNQIAMDLQKTSDQMGQNVKEISEAISNVSNYNKNISERIEETAVTVADSSVHSMDVLADMDNMTNESKKIINIMDDMFNTEEKAENL